MFGLVSVMWSGGMTPLTLTCIHHNFHVENECIINPSKAAWLCPLKLDEADAIHTHSQTKSNTGLVWKFAQPLHLNTGAPARLADNILGISGGVTTY